MTNSARNLAESETPPLEKRRALHLIAVFEAVKGVAALAAIVGFVDLLHHDVRHLAVELIGHFGLNPDAHYPSILLHYADQMPGADIRSLVLLACGYIFVRWLEAYGLWNDLDWGEWLGAISGALYIPFEIGHLLHRLSVIGTLVFAGNVVVVGFLIYTLWRSASKAHNRQPPDSVQ